MYRFVPPLLFAVSAALFYGAIRSLILVFDILNATVPMHGGNPAVHVCGLHGGCIVGWIVVLSVPFFAVVCLVASVAAALYGIRFYL
jgi:hypothetical protein